MPPSTSLPGDPPAAWSAAATFAAQAGEADLQNKQAATK